MKTIGIAFIVLLTSLVVVGSVAAQESTDLPAISGTIAYIGADYNVYLFDGAAAITQITTDAGPNGDHLQLYQWPTWANDGRLAYFRTSVGTGGAVTGTDVLVSKDGNPGTELYSGAGQIFNYASWSPQNCAGAASCRDLAVLLSDSKGLFVEMVRDGVEPPRAQVAGAGAPFYTSWSPDGQRMLWQRDNNRIDIYDAEANEVVNSLAVVPGQFLTPGWSPVDDRLLFGALNSDGASTDLVISANGQTSTLVPKLRGPITFSWSPDGNAVAYDDRQGPLMVVDAVSGETLARSPSTGVLAYFWSPDSHLIAYVTLTAGVAPPGSFSAYGKTDGVMASLIQGQAGLVWTVLDVSTGATRSYVPFIPTSEMIYLLTYFDQFAQSHRLWSPDSHHLIYSEVQPGDRQVVTLLDVTHQDTVPLSVAEGMIGVWSFQ